MAIGDNCDRSPAEKAYTAWYNPGTRGLVVLCAHHTVEHELALIAQGFKLTIDDRETLMRSTREPEPA